MSTVADLPPSALCLTGPSNAWQGSQDATNREETLTWKVPWGDSNAFYAAVVGQMTSISYGNGVSIKRRIPLQHPYNPAMWASRLAWRGQDGPSKPPGAPYAWVIVNITFGFPGYSMGSDSGGGAGAGEPGYPPFCKIAADITPRLVTDTSRQYSYTNDTGTSHGLNQNVAKSFGGSTYRVQLFAIPNLDAWQTLVAPLCGMVNSQPFQVGTFTRDVGTVLFEGYGFEADQDVMGNARWTGTVSLNCSSLPWNKVFVNGKVYPLSPAPYGTADLNTLYY